jgi:hypothetical protein
VALVVLEKKILKYLANFCGFSLPVWKIFGISEPFKQILKMPTQGTFLPKISFLDIIVFEKIFEEMLNYTILTYCADTAHIDILEFSIISSYSFIFFYEFLEGYDTM